MNLLDNILSPTDLKQLSLTELKTLTEELRQFLIESVSKTGGHLSSNLGVVELTVALHYVFNTPEDRLVWDVGHQTYLHKILTGRKAGMPGLRQFGGISGFPKRSESPFDTFGTGHSSTSISAGLGMATALQRKNLSRSVVAIIGDGAMTAGMAFEALNNAGTLDTNLIVILNDNDMSISENVGALRNAMAKILSSHLYDSVRRSSAKVLGVVPPMLEFVKRAEGQMKSIFMPGAMFEELGFNYLGPIDGHDLETLITTLGNVKELQGPQFLHIITQKGRGYSPAESQPSKFHGVGQFDFNDGQQSKKETHLNYTQVFSRWIVETAKREPRLMAITPAMTEGSGLREFAKQYPERFFDVGIAEQHAITFSAGLACEGFRPVVAIYSTFLQRAYDQWIHDVVLQNLPVMLAIDRAGIVGADGATHSGSFDLSFLRCIPNVLIMAPSSGQECIQMLNTALSHEGPSAVRYPRGEVPEQTIQFDTSMIPIAKAELKREGTEIALLSFGRMLPTAMEVGEALSATVVNMRFIKPMDEELIKSLAKTHSLLVTIEENTIQGGAGSAVLEILETDKVALLRLGLPDVFIEHGNPDFLLQHYGLDTAGIIATIKNTMRKLNAL